MILLWNNFANKNHSYFNYFGMLTKWQLGLPAEPKATRCFLKMNVISVTSTNSLIHICLQSMNLNLYMLGTNRTKLLSYGTNKDEYCGALRKQLTLLVGD